MKIRTATIIAMTTISTACGTGDISQWSDQKIDRWFASSEWQTALACKPAPETDRRQFAEQVLGNPDAWRAALEFLRTADPTSLADGTWRITPDGSVRATVARYTTKDSADFEAHRRYIDLHYVIEGRECIQIAPINSVNDCTQPYDAAKDIEFHASATSPTECPADPTRLVILFPNQAHKPCMKVGTNASVRKIVVKIPYIEKR